jgi:DNA-binding transcriptional ArsR family regulator
VAERKRGGGTPEQKWAKVKPRRLRIRIVAVAHLRNVTPKEFATEERLPPATVQYHFNVLEQEGWIRVCRKERVGNVVRNWYTADHLKIISDREFEQMNEKERFENSEGVLKHYLKICRLALEKGTLDARPDSQLSQIVMGLDQRGWNDLQVEMDIWLERLLEFRVEAEMRMRDSGEEPIPTVAHIASFEVPRAVFESAKAPQT